MKSKYIFNQTNNLTIRNYMPNHNNKTYIVVYLSVSMSSIEPGSLRAQIQIVLAVLLIGSAIALVGTFVYTQGFENEIVQEIVREAWTLLILGVGAALAIFGLGRTVTPNSK